MDDWSGIRCFVCGGEFVNQNDWYESHTIFNGDAYVHSPCCFECHPDFIDTLDLHPSIIDFIWPSLTEDEINLLYLGSSVTYADDERVLRVKLTTTGQWVVLVDPVIEQSDFPDLDIGI